VGLCYIVYTSHNGTSYNMLHINFTVSKPFLGTDLPGVRRLLESITARSLYLRPIVSVASGDFGAKQVVALHRSLLSASLSTRQLCLPVKPTFVLLVPPLVSGQRQKFRIRIDTCSIVLRAFIHHEGRTVKHAKNDRRTDKQ